jgi:hypothetical protein
LKAGFWVALLLTLAGAGQAEDRAPLPYRLVGPDEPSSRSVAQEILGHLAAGEIDQAARLSNEPGRRSEVLRDYLRSVGEAEFRRVYAEYLRPPNGVVAEIAIGPRRLLVWQLGERLAGQYYIEADGTFVMDDRPGPERRALQNVLAQQRKERGAKSARP